MRFNEEERRRMMFKVLERIFKVKIHGGRRSGKLMVKEGVIRGHWVSTVEGGALKREHEWEI